jgi:hypothetical protein
MDFCTNLSMKGKTTDEMVRSAGGEASLHAHDLTLEIGDIDKELSHYEFSQSFNLVDVGAFSSPAPSVWRSQRDTPLGASSRVQEQ